MHKMYSMYYKMIVYSPGRTLLIQRVLAYLRLWERVGITIQEYFSNPYFIIPSELLNNLFMIIKTE